MATIQGVYVALFGRPADPAGLAYFNGITNGGTNLAGIASLAGTAEYQARFAGQSNTQVVTAIYQSLFNRAPEAAGLNFFVDALNKGTLNINNVAIAILDGAQGDDKTIITNKLTAADNFTKALDTAVEIGSYQGNTAAQQGRNFLSTVTKDTATVPSVDAANTFIATIVATPPGTTPTTGVSINITAATDTVDPNNANPSFKSTTADDTINITTAAHLKSTSVYDGAAGNDTLKIVVTGAAIAAATTNAPTLKGIETVSVKTNDDAAISFAKTTGLSSVVTDGLATGKTVAYTDVAAGVSATLKGTITGGALSVTVKDAATNANDALTLKLDSTVDAASASNVALVGIETVTLDLTGASKVGELYDASLQTLKVTGSGNVEIVKILDAAAGTTTTLKTVDASAATGSVKLDLSTASGVKYTGSKGIDTVTLTAKADTIVYNSTNAATANKIDSFTGFTAAGDDKDKIDLSAFASAITGNKTVITPFTAAMADKDSFNGNAVAVYKNGTTDATVYVDSNGNGTFDIGTDLAIKLVGDVTLTKDNFVF